MPLWFVSNSECHSILGAQGLANCLPPGKHLIDLFLQWKNEEWMNKHGSTCMYSGGSGLSFLLWHASGISVEKHFLPVDFTCLMGIEHSNRKTKSCHLHMTVNHFQILQRCPWILLSSHVALQSDNVDLFKYRFGALWELTICLSCVYFKYQSAFSWCIIEKW